MEKTAPEKLTPLMQQYFDIKQQFPDTLLFFQVGDFYELFFDDAKVAAAYLAITLTKRGKNNGIDIPLCGVPVHALDHYLVKLIKGGFKVALCDQLTKPQPGTVVQRAVTRVFTPGTLIDAGLLDDKSASYLLTFYPMPDRWGILFTELLTAQLFATTVPVDSYRHVEAELIRFFPDEVILPKVKKIEQFDTYFKKMGYCTSFIEAQVGTNSLQSEQEPVTTESHAWIEQQFPAQTVRTIAQQPVLEQSLTTLYHYLKRNQAASLQQFKSIQFYEPDDYLILDAATQKNLEIINNTQDGGRKNTLFSVLDCAKTAMGSRTIKKWLSRPLVQKTSIIQRQEVVSELVINLELTRQLENNLSNIADIERIIGRIALMRATLHDYSALKVSLTFMPKIKQLLGKITHVSLAQAIAEKIADFTPLVQLLEQSINDDMALGYTIKPGFDLELDRLRSLSTNGHEEILALEQQERIRTGITSLKIGYTNQTGYYIEITNPNLDKVPSDFMQQQTMVGRKRFISQQLKALEVEILQAAAQIEQLEATIFSRIKLEVAHYLAPLRHAAQSIAYLDGLFGFATAAHQNRYVTPKFNDQQQINIQAGRHPVVEASLGHQFVPNDTTLTTDESLWVITGPNMGGKSTYLRQVGLICIMAQCGSLVPAHTASLPILDRIFTRIGSGDDVAQGKSTFLVEMEETAVICTQATDKSLVILDEVGRGTSTFDGIALAQAIIEHIFTRIKAKCLFATHYHELTELAATLDGIKNYHLASSKKGDTLLFLHKIEPGIAPGSFGLDVAKLAQLPSSIINRAKTILNELQTASGAHHHSAQKSSTYVPAHTTQTDNQEEPYQIIKKLEQQVLQQQDLVVQLTHLDMNELTPRQALEFIWKIKDTLNVKY